MPTYQYRCTNCKNEFELRQGFDSDPMADCPKCGNLSTRRISLVPVIFKGSGWYVTDYGRGGRTSSSGDGHEDDGASESKETPKAEVKPESSEKPEPSEKPKQEESKTGET